MQQLWEPAALFDALHISTGITRTIQKLFEIAQKTVDKDQIMREAQDAIKNCQINVNQKHNNHMFARAVMKMIMIGEFKAAKSIFNQHPRYSHGMHSKYIEEVLKNIAGLITREAND